MPSLRSTAARRDLPAVVGEKGVHLVAIAIPIPSPDPASQKAVGLGPGRQVRPFATHTNLNQPCHKFVLYVISIQSRRYTTRACLSSLVHCFFGRVWTTYPKSWILHYTDYTLFLYGFFGLHIFAPACSTLTSLIATAFSADDGLQSSYRGLFSSFHQLLGCRIPF